MENEKTKLKIEEKKTAHVADAKSQTHQHSMSDNSKDSHQEHQHPHQNVSDNKEHNHEHAEHEHTHEHKSIAEVKSSPDTFKEPKKPELKKIKKEEAVARGSSLPISLKQSMAIGRFIRGKTIDGAIALLQDVIKFKRPVPYVGEIPHRSYPGVMSGRYPITASKYFINTLKALKGNCLVAGLELDKVRIFSTSPSWASRPQQRGGATFKRLNLVIIAREIKSNSEKKEKKK